MTKTDVTKTEVPEDPPARFLTQRDVARFFGVSQPVVSRWGLLSDEDGCYPTQAICRELARQRGGESTGRERMELAKAELAELDVEERTGNLVRRDAAREQFANCAAAVCQGILGVPAKVAREVASEGDEAAVARILVAALTKELEALSAPIVEDDA